MGDGRNGWRDNYWVKRVDACRGWRKNAIAIINPTAIGKQRNAGIILASKIRQTDSFALIGGEHPREYLLC